MVNYCCFVGFPLVHLVLNEKREQFPSTAPIGIKERMIYLKKILCIALSAIMLLSVSVYAFASDISVLNEAEQAISLIENELYVNNTSVVYELSEMKNRLITLLKTTTDEDVAEKISSQIETLDEMIDEYESYKDGTLAVPYGSFHLIYSPAVSAIVAYFNSNDYYLAAELLTHAKENDTVDSFYAPTYGYLIKQTTEYNNVYSNGGTRGNSEFNKTGRTVDDDFYYAIHGFTYYRDTLHRTLEFYDRYDYAVADYDSIQGVAVNTMYNAQEAGVIVPFRLTIAVSI